MLFRERALGLLLTTSLAGAVACSASTTDSEPAVDGGTGSDAATASDSATASDARADSAYASETSTDGNTAVDAGCTDSLANVAGMWGAVCPSSYAAATDPSLVCSFASGATSIATCAGLSQIKHDWQTHWVICLYQGDTLVGAVAENDVNSFCNGTAYIEQAGDVPPMCLVPVNVPVTCVDGGIVDAAAGD
jgi:hypothetical protein